MLMLCRYACYVCYVSYVRQTISATGFYFSGTYLYVKIRLSEIKCLLFRAPGRG